MITFAMSAFNLLFLPLLLINSFIKSSQQRALRQWRLGDCCTGTDARTYMYLGCFKDSNTALDISGPQFTLQGDLTVEKCTTQCQSNGYPYAGLQMGSTCFCGNSYGSLGATISKYCCRYPYAHSAKRRYHIDTG